MEKFQPCSFKIPEITPVWSSDLPCEQNLGKQVWQADNDASIQRKDQRKD